jgi:hypothetical protein
MMAEGIWITGVAAASSNLEPNSFAEEGAGDRFQSADDCAWVCPPLTGLCWLQIWRLEIYNVSIQSPMLHPFCF